MGLLEHEQDRGLRTRLATNSEVEKDSAKEGGDVLEHVIGNEAEVEGEWIKKGAAYEFIGTRVTFTSAR
mgnify:CR=1 FL=1